MISIKDWPSRATYEEVLKSIELDGNIVDGLGESELRRLAQLRVTLGSLKQRRPIEFYKPYESREKPGWHPQLDFHASMAKIRLLIGGNRTGKTESGIAEDILVALGKHPFWKCQVPNAGWIVSMDNNVSRDVAEDKFRKMCPSEDILRWDNTDRIVYFKNGSTIGFKSVEQDVSKFQGKALCWTHFDEEPPGNKGYQIYKECLARLMDYRGRMWFTLTPTGGFSWTFDEFFDNPDPDVHVTEIKTWENPYIPMEEIEKLKQKLSSDDLAMRLEGKYIHFTGLVYKEFDKNKHIIPHFAIPADWKRFRGLDHGVNNPTACLWVAVNDKDEFYVYDEYYETGKTVKENAEAIKSITGGERIEWTCIDPACDARDPISHTSVRAEYRLHGIPTRALRTDKMLGINAIKQLLLDNHATGRPRLFVFDHCYCFLKELQRYRWKGYRGVSEQDPPEQTLKVDDHLLDAMRYLVMSRPNYKVNEDTVRVDELDPDPWYK